MIKCASIVLIGALQGLAPERVLYAGSASKILAPGLRLGWMLAPAQWLPALVQAKRVADRGSPVLDQLTLGAFLQQGGLDLHLRRSRKIYRRRRDVLIAALKQYLPRLELCGAATGPHLMLNLGARIDETTAVQAAAAASVRLHGASNPRLGYHAGTAALILGYGGLAEPRIAETVRHLALALRDLSG